MLGVLLTDSLMCGCPDDAIERLRVNQGLKELDVQCFPGYTTGKLIGGNGEIHSLIHCINSTRRNMQNSKR